ncbi:hypothetical protein QYM36_012157 [Artemia franciscana]|uniref:Uncharacterized protein n=1 Tax=Artemia franciscana TaxID=6661 RepID=A0AA88HU89_ARTSF|nr:hypothetical protein QYM36_012157 [Artemia franciscana]
MDNTETKPPKKYHQEFEKYLQANWRHDWKNKYLNYGSLNRRVEKSDKLKGTELKTEMDQFFCDCIEELKTVNDFFKEKLEELIGKKETLEKEALEMKEKWTAVEERKSLRYDFHLLYVDFMMLNNYQKLNFVGFRKILKKFDHHQLKSHKKQCTDGEKWREDNVENAYFYSCNKIGPLMKEIEDFYASIFDEDKDTTVKRLLYFHSEKTQKIIYLIPSVFLVMIVLSVVLMILYNIFPIPIKIRCPDTSQNDKTFNWNILLKLYRGPLWVVLHQFLNGLNILLWRKRNINYIQVLGIEPRSDFSGKKFCLLGGINALVWWLSIIAFFFAPALGVSHFIFHLLMAILLILTILIPIPYLTFIQRWLRWHLFRVILAPFFDVGFCDFWLADQITSLSLVFGDAADIIALYSQTHWYEQKWTCITRFTQIWWLKMVLLCWPYNIRLIQCCRRAIKENSKRTHLLNALKYVTGISVIIFSMLYGAYHLPVLKILWIILSVVSSIYGIIWDVKMDWGLGNKKNKFLREKLLIGSSLLYYVCILLNIILRFTWTFSLSITEAEILDTEITTTIFSALELFRRFMWNIFRVENEQINNCGGFRDPKIKFELFNVDSTGNIYPMDMKSDTV